jgi:uncharacterized protein (DUF1778 family)
MAAIGASPPARSARLGLRARPEQEAVLRRAAEVSHKSLTDFILDSACLAAEQALLDQRLFMVSGSQAKALIDAGLRPRHWANSHPPRSGIRGGLCLRNVRNAPRNQRPMWMKHASR